MTKSSQRSAIPARVIVLATVVAVGGCPTLYRLSTPSINTHTDAAKEIKIAGDDSSVDRCRSVQAMSQSLTGPVPDHHARLLIDQVTAQTTSRLSCPVFMNNYPEAPTDPYMMWQPWQSMSLHDMGYSTEGISCQSEEFCDLMYAANDTQHISRVIYDNQHPHDCSEARFLVLTKEWNGGIGANIHVKAWMLLVALSMDRVLIDSPKINWDMTNQENCPAKDWSCYFAKLTHCTLPFDWEDRSIALNITHLVSSAGRRQQFVHSPVHTKLASLALNVSKSAVVELNTRVLKKPSSWWMAHATSYLTRPNIRTLSVACFYWNCMTISAPEPTRPMASVFVRSGDKWKEATLQNTSAHMRSLDAFVSAHPHLRPGQVYFGTDNAQILSNAIHEYSHEWSMTWFGYHRSDGGMTHEQTLKRSHSPQIELQILMTLTDAFLSLNADIFVGTLSSNHNRLVDELRKVHGKGRIPYLTPEKTLYSWP